MIFLISYKLLDAFPGVKFNNPVFMINDPVDSGVFYVVEQVGVILKVKENKVDTLLNIRHRVKYGGEMGLLGMELHPEFPKNGKYYISYTDNAMYSTVEEREINQKDYSRVLLKVRQPFTNHNGGHIEFGPDGYLYLGLGDGGAAGDPLNNAQNPKSLLGKILRIDVKTGKVEIYAMGLRNPWRFSFDGNTLWVGDVGQNRWEEIDTVIKGGNYGWRCYEGNHPYNLKGCKEKKNYIFPVWEYRRSNGNCAVIGGYVYRGKMLKNLYGVYVFGDYCSGRIWGLKRGYKGFKAHLLIDTDENISSFAVDNYGEIYVIGHTSGKIYRLVE